MPSLPEIKLIAGLGNPGTAYKNTYHNAGLLALGWLVKNRGDVSPWKKIGGLFEYAKSNNLILIKPLVFMNESGGAIALAKKYFKIPTENILIIHDDSDLEVGHFKVTFNKSSAGHKGVESVINALRGAGFWRMRIGVRGQKSKKRALDFVLKKISPAHQHKLNEVFKKTLELLPTVDTESHRKSDTFRLRF